jgi:hypothetical protein
LPQKLNGLAFGYTEKHLFTAETGRKSIFHICECHIPAC